MVIGSNGKVDLEKVMSENWNEVFEPLPWIEVNEAWEQVLVEEAIHDKTLDDLHFTVLKFCDKGQLSFDRTFQGAPCHIFPARLSQLFCEDSPQRIR